MKFSISHIVYRISLAAISALLLILSFPPFNIWILAWIAFVPLFFALEDQKPLKAFLLSCPAGFIFFLGTIYWLIHVTLPGMIIVVAYLALYFGFFGAIIGTYNAVRITQYAELFSIPAAWTTLEWIRSHALTGFGWQLVGYSQSFNLPIIQIADLTGVWGVSFLVIMVNAAIFMFIKNARERTDKKAAVMPLVIAVLAVLITASYGVVRLNSAFTGEKIRVAVVQGNIPQDEKWDRRFREMILLRYEGLTRQASKEGPELVIWPESSVPGFIENEKDLFENVRNLTIEIKTPILLGSPRYEETRSGELYYNSAYLFLKDGTLNSHYDKVHLVPFGEYLPFKDALSFVHNFAPRPIGDFTAGKEFKVFSFFIKHRAVEKDYSVSMVKRVGFSSLICFEDIFPDLAREFVKRGALLLVNITNDGWFGYTPAAYQHAQNSIFRAVENRVNVIRAANRGLSCFIDQKGAITARVEKAGKDLFVEGFKVHDIVLSKTRTVYNTYGDLFAYICIFFTMWSIVHCVRADLRGTA